MIFHPFLINIAKMMGNHERMMKNDDSPAKVQISFFAGLSSFVFIFSSFSIIFSYILQKVWEIMEKL